MSKSEQPDHDEWRLSAECMREKRTRDREIVWGSGGDEKELSDSALIGQLCHAFAKDRQANPGRPAQPLHGRDYAGATEGDRAGCRRLSEPQSTMTRNA